MWFNFRVPAGGVVVKPLHHFEITGRYCEPFEGVGDSESRDVYRYVRGGVNGKREHIERMRIRE